MVQKGHYREEVVKVAKVARAAKDPVRRIHKALLVERWPGDLHRELKVAAVLQDRTLRECLIEAAQDWLKKKGRA